MKTIICKFTVEADKTEIVEVEVSDTASESEIQNEIEFEFDKWVDNNTICNIERL